MGVGDFGGTQALSTPIVTPIVQTTQLPPGADLPIDPHDVARGALEGEAGECKIIMQQLITMLLNNATHMNPVDISGTRRTLEQSASKGSAAAIAALRTKESLTKVERMLISSSAMSREDVPFSSLTNLIACRNAFRNLKNVKFENCLLFRHGKRNLK